MSSPPTSPRSPKAHRGPRDQRRQRLGTSVNRVAAELARLLGFAGDIRVSGRYRAGDIRHNVADVALLEAELGLRCGIAFDTGLATFVDWARTELAGGPDSDGYARSLAELSGRGLMKGG